MYSFVSGNVVDIDRLRGKMPTVLPVQTCTCQEVLPFLETCHVRPLYVVFGRSLCSLRLSDLRLSRKATSSAYVRPFIFLVLPLWEVISPCVSSSSLISAVCNAHLGRYTSQCPLMEKATFCSSQILEASLPATSEVSEMDNHHAC